MSGNYDGVAFALHWIREPDDDPPTFSLQALADAFDAMRIRAEQAEAERDEYRAAAGNQTPDSLKRERAALVQVNKDLSAERDRLRAALEETVERFGPWHEEDCPADDTCDCSAKPLHDKINAALRPEDA